MDSKTAWQHLKEKFTSSNCYEVERTTITKEEYEAIKPKLEENKE